MTDKQPEALKLADAMRNPLRWHELTDEERDQVAAELQQRLHAENEAIRAAIKKLHSSRGRYHTQIAACDLYDMCNLPTVRPTK